MYRILGIDGRIYGPATAGQVRQWLAEGRVQAQTQTLAEGATEWKPLFVLPEFAGCFPSLPPPVIAPLRPVPLSPGQMPRTNSFAMAGMIFGILALTLTCCCCYGFPFNLLGIVCSAVGLAQVNRHPDRYEGRSMALAGLILSIVSLLFIPLLMLLSLLSGPGRITWKTGRF